jgi:hypothetical protein
VAQVQDTYTNYLTTLPPLQCHTPQRTQHQAYLILHVFSICELLTPMPKLLPALSNRMFPAPYGLLTILRTISLVHRPSLQVGDRPLQSNHSLVESKMLVLLQR